jgi:hypothetical protein
MLLEEKKIIEYNNNSDNGKDGEKHLVLNTKTKCDTGILDVGQSEKITKDTNTINGLQKNPGQVFGNLVQD